MKHTFLILFAMLLLGSSAMAQQEAHYSQYMFNGLVLNPAYAGSRDQVSANILYRNQWVNVDGAPVTTSFSVHGPSANLRHGFGLTLVNDDIGVTRDLAVNLDYAFRIPVGEEAKLALGLQGQIANYRANLDQVRTANPGNPNSTPDPAFTGNAVNMWLPNVGAGIYFNSKNFYIGASSLHLIQNDLNEEDALQAQRYLHVFGTAGLILNLGKVVQLKPSTLVKYTEAAGVQFDANLSFLFAEKVWIGASYRTEDAVVGLVQFQITPQLSIGYAYDYTISDLTDYSNGSHELMLGFDFNFKRSQMVSPRKF